MSQSNALQFKPSTLPDTLEGMLARKTMKSTTLNDYVDQIHVKLYLQDSRYTELLDAVHDEQAVEGSLSIDNAMAAEVIREYANNNGIDYVKKLKLATIVKSLNVVLRRYKITRQQRANEVGGEQVEK